MNGLGGTKLAKAKNDFIPQERPCDQSEEKTKGSLEAQARLPDLAPSGGDCPE
jgi:hypothetical protein